MSEASYAVTPKYVHRPENGHVTLFYGMLILLGLMAVIDGPAVLLN